MTFAEDVEEVLHDLRPMFRFLLPIALVAALLAMNLAMHAGAYVRPDRPIYVAPTITSPPPGTTVAAPVTTTTTVVPVAPADDEFDHLADCESGTRDKDAAGFYTIPVHGSRDWASTSDGYEGGVHFKHSTWLAFRPAGYPESAADATPAQQKDVARRVLRVQGPAAWPSCSRIVGLR